MTSQPETQHELVEAGRLVRAAERRACSGRRPNRSAIGEGLPQLQIGALSVGDLSQAEVVSAIVDGAVQSAGRRPWRAFALHVGGLNARADEEYVTAMAGADLAYADGVSVVALARLAGGTHVERAATTDIGWPVLDGIATGLGRPARVALVGGRAGLARRAGEVAGARQGIEVVLAEHGYHSDWTQTLRQLAACRPDVVLVGLGAPQEMKWVERHLDELPDCLIMTCGGWFGFIAQDEVRAPSLLQRLGLEWVHRTVLDPRRLAARYAVGALSTLSLARVVLAQRADRRP